MKPIGNITRHSVIMPVMMGAWVAVAAAGCVSAKAHEHMLADLAERCRAATQEALAAEREHAPPDVAAAARIKALEQEQARIAKEYLLARNQLGQTQNELESTRYHLDQEQEARQLAERRSRDLEEQRRALSERLAKLGRRLEVTEEQLDHGTEGKAATQARVAALVEERQRLANQLLGAQSSTAQAEERLAIAQRQLADAQEEREETERERQQARERSEQLQRLEQEVRRERDRLRMELADATARLRASREALVKSLSSFGEIRDRLTHLEDERNQAKAALNEAKSQTKRLQAALAAEREIWTGLQEALRKVERPSQPKAEKRAP